MEYRPKSARLPRSAEDREKWKRVIIILEHCPLQSIQTDKGYALLTEKHRQHHAVHKQDPSEWRPDVVHQCLLHLQDSALNRAGMLEVFLRTKKGVIIAIDPRLRVPRHMHLFEKMMVSLLYRLSVRSTAGYLSLLRVVRNPITDHIPAGCSFFRIERDGVPIHDIFSLCATCGETQYNSPEDLLELGNPAQKKKKIEKDDNAIHEVAAHPTQSVSAAGTADFALQRRRDAEKNQFKPFAFIIGGMSKGNVEVDYAPNAQSISLGARGMSAAAVISTILHGFEDSWLKNDNEAS